MRDASATGAAAVRLVGLTKRFGHVMAVDGIDLTIPAGSFFALLGPSGCGKTTTLRMIGGLEDPTEGQILIDDEDVTHRKPYKRPVNTVFQSYALFPHLSIFENVAFGLRRTRAPDVRERVEEMLELVQLTGYGERRPAELSGGQQQRVALARALINQPKVLLLDEPLGALDLKLRRQMQVELKRIQTDVGITFVHVTHDQEEAMTMADTIAVMHDGQVEQLGGPVDLYERPRTAFVANFLGQSNLLTGRVTARSGAGAVVEVAGVPVHVADVDERRVGEAVSVGVRPEKLTISRAGQGHPGGAGRDAAEDRAVGDAGVNVLRGVVDDSSFSGVSTQYLVTTPWGQQVAVFVQNVGAGDVLRVGEEVRLTWDPQHSFCVSPDGAAAGALAESDEAAGVDGRTADRPAPAQPEPAETPGTIADAVETEVQTRP